MEISRDDKRCRLLPPLLWLLQYIFEIIVNKFDSYNIWLRVPIFTKMASNFADNSLMKSSSAHLSIRNQTKEKFEALLKSAVHKKSFTAAEVSKSREHLLNNLGSPASSAENISNIAKETETYKCEKPNENKNYILNKFFDESLTKTESESSKIEKNKIPIPKPRRNKPVSITNKGTFEAALPKRKMNESSSSEVSNATYNIEDIGDVLIHKSPLKPKIIVKENLESKFTEKSESKILTDSGESHISESKDEQTKFANDMLPYGESKDVKKESSFNKAFKSKNKKQPKITEEEKSKKIYTYEKIVEITILKTDKLPLNSLVVHPLIKIHVIDAITGKYFPKSDKSRSVVFFYETADINYISPVMTHACNLQEKK